MALISGPITAPGSSGRPTGIAATAAATFSTISSYRDCGAKMRVCATQACPEFISPANNSIGSEASRSASSRMIAADLPPSSSVHGLSLSAASLPTSLPTAELPVKVYLSTFGLAVSARPVSGPPGTTDSTPSGSPAAAKASAMALTVSGVSAAGFSTTVQPASRAGPSLLQARNIGTFQAATAPTTPIGSRSTRVWP